MITNKSEAFLCNRVAIESTFLDEVIHLLDGTFDDPYEQFLSFSSLLESVVLNESILLKDGVSFVSSSSYERTSREDRLAAILGSVVDFKGNEPAIKMIGSIATNAETTDEDEDPEVTISRLKVKMNEACWDIGIPLIDSPTYSETIESRAPITKIATSLYKKIENSKKPYFEQLRACLGGKQFQIPSITAIVLSRSKEFHDFIPVMNEVREEYKEFRKRCSELEIELRQPTTLREKFKIIDEIQNTYAKTKGKQDKSKHKTRKVYTLFDIVKSADPLKMGTTVIDKAIEYDLEKQAILRIPGYYDLWNASLDVENSYDSILRIFGKTFADALAKRM